MVQIWSYFSDNSRKAELDRVCKALQLSQGQLTPKDLNRTIRTIIGAPMIGSAVSSRPAGISQGEAFAAQQNSPSAACNASVSAPPFFALPEIILFSGMDSDALDRFLAETKAQQMAPVQLKAIVTPYNLNWTLYQLIEQLKEEA